MSDSVHRVKISRVLRGCDDLEPPIQPPGADEEEPSVLRTCFGLFLLWPKSMIRVGTTGAITPQTTAPPVVPATSGGKAPLPPSPSPPRGGRMIMLMICTWRRIRPRTTKTGMITSSTLSLATKTQLVAPQRNPLSPSVCLVLRRRLQLAPSPSQLIQPTGHLF